jgi:hypothetical protein
MSGPPIPKTPPIRQKRIKPKRVIDKDRLARVAMLPCMVCGHWPVAVHHCRMNAGTGQKAGDDETIPLCAWHHQTGPQAFHNGPRIFQELYGTELELLAQTNAKLESCDGCGAPR